MTECRVYGCPTNKEGRCTLAIGFLMKTEDERCHRRESLYKRRLKRILRANMRPIQQQIALKQIAEGIKPSFKRRG